MRQYEEQEQRAVVQFLSLSRIRFAHVPNGGRRGKLEAAILKGLGVSRGVPDLLIFDPPPKVTTYVGTAIEMKARKDQVPSARPSPEQREWLRALQDRGWYTAVCHGAGEAIDLLQRLGYGQRRAARIGEANG